jgi:S1-C subfamily serine protease
LAPGDIITSIDDKAVKNAGELVKEIQKKKVGEKVKLNIMREGKPLTIEITTSAMPEKADLGRERGEDKSRA